MKHSFFLSASAGIYAGISREWLLTNARGDYASGTVRGCATRRYHGLLCAQTASGKRMLLSSIEDRVRIQGREYPLSCRLHPGIAWPEGWKLESSVEYNGKEIARVFKLPLENGGCVLLRRTAQLCAQECRLLIRYQLLSAPQSEQNKGIELFARPLVSCRPADYLCHADPAFASDLHPTDTTPTNAGFFLQPNSGTPPLIMNICAAAQNRPSFAAMPDWCYNVLYPVERERGYDWTDDLFMPGTLSCILKSDKPAWICAGIQSLAAAPDKLWQNQMDAMPEFQDGIIEHLMDEGKRFVIRSGKETLIPAGYHWFGPWGRDTFIALPGLTFLAGRVEQGKEILAQIGGQVRFGLVPNLLGNGNGKAAYNSADASLWYMLAVQRLLEECPEEAAFVHNACWPVIKDIIAHFSAGTMPDDKNELLVVTDSQGLLHVGNRSTQLTWMDASIGGQPVTPRHGCAVELNALWYNALLFARGLAQKFGEAAPAETALASALKEAFRRVFMPSGDERQIMGGGLYDAWSPVIGHARQIRPNQVIAAALPYSPLSNSERLAVAACTREHLLTPFGLRTLSKTDPAYRPRCQGSQEQRDMAYHQGTVWPWLLGFYAEALWRGGGTQKDALDLMLAIAPLFTQHMEQAGLGSISEIFDGDKPHVPGGCIAQAWSVAEALRLLLLVRRQWPEAYKTWLAALDQNNCSTCDYADTIDMEKTICVF